MKSQIDKFEKLYPLIEVFTGKELKPAHWDTIFKIANAEVQYMSLAVIETLDIYDKVE